jgi:hypothetical protein
VDESRVFLFDIIPPWFSILIYNLGDEPHFRDLVLPIHMNIINWHTEIKLVPLKEVQKIL